MTTYWSHEILEGIHKSSKAYEDPLPTNTITCIVHQWHTLNLGRTVTQGQGHGQLDPH